VKPAQWVLRETVLALQERLLSEFGGLSGLRDEGLFDSALACPQQQHSFGRRTVIELAAAYAYGLVRNRPFMDGNKRIGFTTAILFLELNATSLRPPKPRPRSRPWHWRPEIWTSRITRCG
jgi:death-on-curing protein